KPPPVATGNTTNPGNPLDSESAMPNWPKRLHSAIANPTKISRRNGARRRQKNAAAAITQPERYQRLRYWMSETCPRPAPASMRRPNTPRPFVRKATAMCLKYISSGILAYAHPRILRSTGSGVDFGGCKFLLAPLVPKQNESDDCKSQAK